MKEQFVSLAIAQQLKEKGFDQSCMAYVYTGDTGTNVDQYVYGAISHDGNPIHENYNVYDMSYSLPLWQQVIDWFRDKHSIMICIDFYDEGFKEEPHIIYHFKISEPKTWHECDIIVKSNYKTYPEARLSAIEHALKLI
jgi:hypothetical protein